MRTAELGGGAGRPQGSLMDKDRVLIAGAGPVGLTLALALHRAGVPVAVFEKRAGLNAASRASTWHPPTLEILDRLGVLAALLPHGVRVDRVAWLRAGKGLAAAMDFSLLADDTRFPFRWHFEQASATPALLAALPAGTVRFDTAVTGAAQDRDGVLMTLADGSAEHGRLAVAADGAHSALRTAASIGVAQGGYGHRVLRLVTALPLEDFLPGLAGAGVAYVFDGEASVSLLKMPGVWRMIIRVPATTDDEAARTEAFRAPILQRFFPELPAPLKLVEQDVYGVAKGIAERMRVGRVLVIGDAAHVTNTRGGMNMNAGLHDAATLAATIVAGGDLDAWARAREAVTRDVLLERTDRAVTTGAAWLDAAIEAAGSPAKARAWLAAGAMLDTATKGNPA
jgi:2-polyprenyl-6-methoxyphenol hydroxylase-like FAD-dependent oxidoreductase